MNETTEMTTLLQKLEENAAVQKSCAKRQSLLMTIAALACVGILILIAVLFFQLQPVVEEMSLAAQNLSAVSEELAALDLASTINGLDETITTAQQSLSEGAAKLEQLDIDTLNSAIKSLSDVVSPLARLFGR